MVLDLQIYGDNRWSKHDLNQKYIINDDSYQVSFIAEEKLDYTIIIKSEKVFIIDSRYIYFSN